MSRRVVLVSLALALVAGCSEPPTKEYQQAEAAVAVARNAQAGTYAPDDLQAAEASLQKYEEAVAQRDYRQALNLAIDARDRAYDATKHAGDAKAAAQAQAVKLAGEIETLTATANARLAGTATPRPSAQAADRIRAALKGSSAALQEARTLISVQDYRGAIVRLTPAVEALRKEVPPAPAGRGRGR
jgi:small-conductance mechanosensitive channel